MKFKLIILLFLVSAGQFGLAQNTRIGSFSELMQSLNEGGQVRVVIHYSLCKWADQTNLTAMPNAITGMDIDTYEYFAPGAAHNMAEFVVFANSKLIQNPIGKGFVYNYGKVRINADNTIQVTAKYVHPKSFMVLMNEVFIGTINDGKNGGGLDLFLRH